MSSLLERVAGGVGQGVAKRENPEKVNGRALYIADLYRPGMLHGAILASPHAHARIRGYDVSAALAAPGVVAVLTGDDVGEGRMGAFIKDEHALAKGKTLYVGEPVAAVAAETEEQARAACRLIRVDYEELPAVLSPEEGLAPWPATSRSSTPVRRATSPRARTSRKATWTAPGTTVTWSSRTSSPRRRRRIWRSSPAARWPRSTAPGG